MRVLTGWVTCEELDVIRFQTSAFCAFTLTLCLIE